MSRSLHFDNRACSRRNSSSRFRRGSAFCAARWADRFRLAPRRIIPQTDDLLPYKFVQSVLSNGTIGTHRAFQPAVSIRSDTAVIVQFLFRGRRRCSIQTVAALLTDQHSLQQSRLNGAPRRVVLFFSSCSWARAKVCSLGRCGQLDPVWAWPFMISAITTRYSVALAQGPGDSLSRP